MSNKNSPIKISTYTNYLGQFHNKVFDKTSNRHIKYPKNNT